MQWFLNFIKTMSVLSVFLAGIWILVPRSSTMKSFRFAIGLFVVAGIISCFTSISVNDFETDFLNTENKEYITTANFLDKVSLEYAINKLFTENSIKCKKIEIITDKSSDDSIHITKAVAYLLNDDDYERAARMVLNQTGIPLELGG